MPKPRKGESQKKYVRRAIPMIAKEHPEMKNDQRVAVAYSMYRQAKNKRRRALTE